VKEFDLLSILQGKVSEAKFQEVTWFSSEI